jgi:glutathione S-transferase
MTMVLYSGTRNASSWSFRAWLTLRELGLAFEERVVDIRRPQRYANLARIAEFSPPGAIPVLVDDGCVIFDSLAIMEYANELGGGALLPRDPRRRARARSLLAWVHSGMSGLCADVSFESVFHETRPALTPDGEAQLRKALAILESELQSSGGPYLAGDPSLADLAFVPVVLRLGSRARDLAPWPHFAAWQERLLHRPSVEEWMDEARRLPPVYE